jgi:tRNA A37 threonylcarbamoyladenosine synthetase subunit TsaC/SUA5/YrdC
MSRPDIKGDARRAFAVLEAGGIAILPMDVGYSAIGGSEDALVKIFEAKQRTPSKLNAMLGDMTLHRELHLTDTRGAEIVAALCEDYDLPLGAIAPARTEHPILKQMTPGALARSSHDGTVLMLLNAGSFHAEICRLSREAAHPLFGSSANLSLSGTKFRVGDIEPEILAIADVVIDHGLRKYHLYKASSTLLDLSSLEVVRYGACFELIADVIARHFGITLKPPPGSGHPFPK